MNVYPGNVSKAEHHFGRVSIILYLIAILFCLFLKEGTFDIVSVASFLIKRLVTIYQDVPRYLTLHPQKVAEVLIMLCMFLILFYIYHMTQRSTFLLNRTIIIDFTSFCLVFYLDFIRCVGKCYFS